MISGLVPSPVTSLSVSNVSTTDITVNWTIPSSEDGNYVTYYIISYTPSCPELSSANDTVSVAPHQSITTYSYTLRGLYSGMNYTITVRAGNVLGGSDSTLISAETQSTSIIYVLQLILFYSFIVPVGIPTSLHFNKGTNRIMWNEVNCSKLNDKHTDYAVIFSSFSTERFIIFYHAYVQLTNQIAE